ncbi:H(+)-transporting V1 sector ATPase subunit G [Tulasnella sp. JGI-2019a]|nr:H(+)-transporting V1 sector ATPase subunit G [Tulasnella sp. JGI-2019a]KAG9036030.1 H(+)-transporting V1 sector ATPase subunit G [Tulasnella sp. JGI-2019a]
MAPSQNSQGIQTLLEAEKEAAKVVQEARQYRIQKLKDARAQAEKEIEKYRIAKDQEFKKYEAEHAGKTQVSQSAVDKETEVALAKITSSFETNKEKVVDKLMDRVTLITLELHRNLQKA